MMMGHCVLHIALFVVFVPFDEVVEEIENEEWKKQAQLAFWMLKYSHLATAVLQMSSHYLKLKGLLYESAFSHILSLIFYYIPQFYAQWFIRRLLNVLGDQKWQWSNSGILFVIEE
mmetsp:Transcript_13494/g.22975  ORF Transcript_13494/g.22975 Transcript_13494/m.22975 type:complete len:116 (+) Transcript_13494:52-399(+)